MPVYAGVRAALAAAGWSMSVPMVSLPNSFEYSWVVLPGSLLLAQILTRLLKNRQRPVSDGCWMGGLLGPLNIPISVLVALLVFHLQSPQHGDFAGLIREGFRSFGLMMLLGLPVAVPSGAILGGVVGLTRDYARRSSADTQ